MGLAMTVAQPDSPQPQLEPIAALARDANRLHEAYQLRYSGHVRLTRDLAGLDRLIADLRDVQDRAERAAASSEGRWPALLGILARRLEEYEVERGAVAQIQAAASRNDRHASALTSRARLVLHRYVRHFAGHSRRDRDLERLREMAADLQQLADALHPLAQHIHLRTVAEEIGGVLGFVAFFRAEFAEISEARRSGGVAMQSAVLLQLVERLHGDWQREVTSQPPETRRIALVQRYLDAMDGVLEGLATVNHANLPDEHQAGLNQASQLLAVWRAEHASTVAVHGQLTPPERAEALWQRADALWQVFRGRWTGELQHPSEVPWLAEIADCLDEIERQLFVIASDPLAGAALVDADRLARLTDALVLVERTCDAATAAQQAG